MWKWGTLLSIFFMAVSFYPVDRLEVRSAGGGGVLLGERVSPGEGFQFSYLHSVDRTPVTGYFLITPAKRIKPAETRFESFGPGLPSLERGLKAEGRSFYVKTDGGEMDRFSFFVSPMTQQVFQFRDRRLNFSSFREGEVVTVSVRSYPLIWEALIQRWKTRRP
ncbi:MAG: DUF1850 domain-containing protein [Desulfobacterota bacterium]|nr:DUF1850 domain-containing protein [Thermodesulfobacteriota bacterium]